MTYVVCSSPRQIVVMLNLNEMQNNICVLGDFFYLTEYCFMMPQVEMSQIIAECPFTRFSLFYPFTLKHLPACGRLLFWWPKSLKIKVFFTSHA